ncbi:MAG TPA: NotI family restriction endonuclease [Terriglobia bacterium]|nr:NotI family restriction endonuclease [Terriglobia bacterium]
MAQDRFGIGEWYGRPFVTLTPEERRRFAGAAHRSVACPFRSTPAAVFPCSKAGGVCSLRLYHQDDEGAVTTVAGQSLRTTCPNRFHQDHTIFSWIGEVLLGTAEPLVVGEVGFLERENGEAGDDVGRIDHILVHPTRDPLHWCALEIQAVYFSGASMRADFTAIREHGGAGIPFPAGFRRPDYRSSGPKRLMPQLQIKVPALRRWGKKLAVVVDEAFFSALGRMDAAQHVSNCDIAWFIVRYDDDAEAFTLSRGTVRLTTLERAVEGLTGGQPVSLETFEARIAAKLGVAQR